MKWSFSLGKIAGIRILMHWTFLLLLGWIVMTEVNKGSSTSTILLTVAYVLCIFICVILHEFGHALTAKKFGIKTRKITLLPIGGMASIERMPEKPGQEFLVAIAGPAVNIAIALIILLTGTVQLSDLWSTEKMQGLVNISSGNFIYALCLVNIILVVFNAIPAFPMDGGRVLRALLSYKMERTKATDIAAKLGQVIGVIFIFLGFFGNILLILIGVFVMFGAYSENTLVQQMEVLKGHTMKEAMMTKYTRLAPDDTLRTAADKLLEGSENNFVVVTDGQVKGVLTKEAIVKNLRDKENSPIEEVMKKEIISFDANDKLTDAFLKLQRDKNRQRLYPIIENDEIAGVIDLENLQEFLMTQSATAMV